MFNSCRFLICDVLSLWPIQVVTVQNNLIWILTTEGISYYGKNIFIFYDILEIKEETTVRGVQNAETPKGQSFINDFVVYMHRHIPLDGRMFLHLKNTRCTAEAHRPDVFQSGFLLLHSAFSVPAGSVFFERCSRRAEELAIRIA